MRRGDECAGNVDRRAGDTVHCLPERERVRLCGVPPVANITHAFISVLHNLIR